MNDVKYFLVLEKRSGDYTIIDINKLDICNGYVSNSISDIDLFTCKFTEEEIKESIKRSNMATFDYLLGNLKIVSSLKHNLSILDKIHYDRVINFIKNDEVFIIDLKNKLYGAYRKVVCQSFSDEEFISGILDRFNTSLKSGNKKSVFKIIEELPYSKSRNIYLYLSNILELDK